MTQQASTTEQKKPLIPELFGRRIVCPQCHGPFTNTEHPDFDTEGKAVFNCGKCGAKSTIVLDLTVSGKPERTSFNKPLTREEYAAIPETDPETVFDCFKKSAWPDIEEFTVQTQTGPQFKPDLLARWLAGNEPFKVDIETGILYFFNGKNWIADAETYLEKAVSLCLKTDYRKSAYENVSFDLRAHIYEKIQFSHNISCLNGLLNVETGEFKPFDVKDMTFYHIATEYNPNAKCPHFEAFISQIVEPEDAALLQEWSGYLPLTDYRFHKMLWAIGSGRNGKGVWQRTMEGILGHDCVAHIGIEEFDGTHNFSLVNLYGKLANFCSEPRTSQELQTNLLKYATGQDIIDAESKNKQKRLSFTNAAKISVLANKFPKCTDQSTGWLERILFLRFPYEFTGSKQIQNLEKQWLDDPEERSGILNWMLTGLKRLLTNGQFTVSRTQDEAVREYLRASDSVSAFVKECGLRNNANFITRPETVFAYNTYCNHYGLTAESANKLSAQLKETPFIKDTQVRINGKLERVWKGITFRVIKEAELTENGLVNEATPKSVTPVTVVTVFETATGILEKVRQIENPVTSVTTVKTPESPKPKTEIVTLDDKISPSDKNVLFYRRLSDSEKVRCEGTTKEGLNCAHLAEFEQTIRGESTKYFYCPDCNKRLIQVSRDNKYKVAEAQPQLFSPKGTD